MEALIEGTVAEQDLNAGNNDPAKDREILGSITRSGWQVLNEPPLFPDVDALFDAGTRYSGSGVFR